MCVFENIIIYFLHTPSHQLTPDRFALIHNHAKALFMIHLILRDFHEIEHGRAGYMEKVHDTNIRFSSCHKTLPFHVNDVLLDVLIWL